MFSDTLGVKTAILWYNLGKVGKGWGPREHPRPGGAGAAETYLAHPRWWIDGGFTGNVFGAGNGNCVNYRNDSDNGWSSVPRLFPTEK